MSKTPYQITHPRPGQTTPDPICVDGETQADGNGTLQGDGQFPPFYVFDPNKQANVAGPFKTRKAGNRAARAYAKANGLTVA